MGKNTLHTLHYFFYIILIFTNILQGGPEPDCLGSNLTQPLVSYVTLHKFFKLSIPPLSNLELQLGVAALPETGIPSPLASS